MFSDFPVCIAEKTARMANAKYPKSATGHAECGLYVTVRAKVNGHVTHVVLSSAGEAFTVEDWRFEVAKRGMWPRAEVDITDIPPRWKAAGLRAFQEGTLTAPTWGEAYRAVYDALDANLVVTDTRYLVVLALYAMMTYFHPLFDFLPILHLLGPSESGKSRALLALAEVAFNGKASGSATPASVFRKAHQGRYTQIITEADDLSEMNSGDQFVKQLQGACTKGEAVVEVTEKGTTGVFRPTTYFGFNPRVLGSTKDFKALTLRNRCIRLDFVKVPIADQTRLRASISHAPVFADARDKLYRLQLLDWRDVADMRDELKRTWTGDDAPTGRTFDKWLPLAALAKLAGEDVFAVVRELAKEGMEEQRRDAANSKAGLLFRFAMSLVRKGDRHLRREQAWDEFLKVENPHGNPNEVPAWAKAYGDAITAVELRQMFGGDRRFWEEMKRHNLIPKKPARHTRTGDEYLLKRDEVRELARLYVDEGDLERRDEPASPRPDVTPTHDACLRPPYTENLRCPTCGAKGRVSFFTHCEDGMWRCVKCGLKETACPRCEGLGTSAPAKPEVEGDEMDLEDAIPF